MLRLTKESPDEVVLVRQGMTEKMGLDGDNYDPGAVDAVAEDIEVDDA